MARKFLNSIDLAGTQLQNALMHPLASDPGSPAAGQLWFNTTSHQLKYYNGTSTIVITVGITVDTTASDISNSAVGDAKAAGSNAQAAAADHVHGREAFATPAIALGTAAAAGAATTHIRSDATIVAFDATNPSTQAVGDAAAVGTATVAARRDHKHAREAFAAPTAETTFGTSSATGSSASVPHADHTHGNPTHVGSDHSAIKLSDLGGANAADIPLNSHKLTGVTDPTNPQDAATKNYVDSVAQGVAWKTSVRAATTAALAANTYANGTAGVGATLTANANGALAAIDGYTPVAGDRILVQNEVAGANNGIYTVSQLGTGSLPYILTRVTDMDQAAEIPNASVFVENGTVNGNQGFIVVSQGPYTLGTTTITWTQFSGLQELTAGTGIHFSGKTIAIDTAWAGQTGITTLGTITTGVWTGTAIAVANGGTGATTAAGARTNLAATTKFEQDIGDGSTTAIAVTHNLGTKAHVVVMYDNSSFAEIEADVVHTSTTVDTITFAVAPASNAYHYVAVG